MKKFLFVCGKNQHRSPTAEVIFSEDSRLDVRSAGLSDESPHVLDGDDLEWADYIFVMTQNHKSRLQDKFRNFLKNKKIINLNIPDSFSYMDPELVDLLKSKITPYILN